AGVVAQEVGNYAAATAWNDEGSLLENLPQLAPEIRNHIVGPSHRIRIRGKHEPTSFRTARTRRPRRWRWSSAPNWMTILPCSYPTGLMRMTRPATSSYR